MITLAEEVMDLKTRLEHVEAVLHRLTDAASQTAVPRAAMPLDQAELLTWLKANGLVREPTAEECRVAAAWDTLAEQDKQRHIDEMHHLVLDPPLSQLLMAQRR